MSFDRRTFLRLSGIGVVGVQFASLLGGCEEFSVTPLGNSEAPFLTPDDAFFVQNGGEGSISGWTRPALTESDWRLRITDLVTPPTPTELATVTFDDLMALKAREITILKTIQCILESPLKTTPTGFMGNAYWTGIPLSAVLERVTIRPTIKRLLFYGADGFYNNIRIGRMTNAAADGLFEPLLVYRQNGKPLSADHGHPVRLIIQERYGYANVKWLTEIRATTFDLETFGTYQQQGFVDDAFMRVNSRSVNMRDGITLAAGPIEITGYAVSGKGAIGAVEVSVDGGPFTPAGIVTLEEITERESLSPIIRQITDGSSYPWMGVWTKWRFRWEATRGTHTIAVRATDSAGNIQPATDTNVFDGQNEIPLYSITIS